VKCQYPISIGEERERLKKVEEAEYWDSQMVETTVPFTNGPRGVKKDLAEHRRMHRTRRADGR